MLRRVFVAMSGGVDSSIAAYFLKEAGYHVAGIHMELSWNSKSAPEVEHADLERTCEYLRIPLYYVHFEAEFKSRVIEYFCDEYSRGRTPNPCIRCNTNIKFGLLLDKVLETGGELLATGHYARVVHEETGYKLLKGADVYKDQSYFLYILGQKELARVLFPVGGMRKAEVKKLAGQLGLPAAVRRESQDICFIPDNDSHAFIDNHLKSNPGDIVDTQGRVLGKHRGLAHYTIGQRQGMGVSSSQRLYVIGMETETNRLIIGPQSQLLKKKILAYNLNWISGHAPQGNIEISAKVRYSSREAKATVHVADGRAEILFAEPQRALAPGQSVVLYQGAEVLGGGLIGQTL